MSTAVQHFSTLSTLSPTQVKVAAALAEGHSVTAAAAAGEVHRTTVHNWFKSDRAFATAVAEARAAYTTSLHDEMRDLSRLALASLRQLLEDPGTPAPVRLRTSLAILARPRFPDPAWILPEPLGTPAQQRWEEEVACLEAECNRARDAAATNRGKRTNATAATAEPDESAIEDPGLSIPEIAEVPASGGTPRNAPCPCGSRVKFKRCCGKDAPPQLNASTA